MLPLHTEEELRFPLGRFNRAVVATTGIRTEVSLWKTIRDKRSTTCLLYSRLTNRLSCHFTGYWRWRITQGFSKFWDPPLPLSLSLKPNHFSSVLHQEGGELYAPLLLPYRNQELESSSATHTHTFPLQPKKYSTHSSHRVLRESSQHPASNKRAAEERLLTFVLWTQRHRHKHLFTAVKSDVCPRCERVHVVKCVHLSMCAGVQG